MTATPHNAPDAVSRRRWLIAAFTVVAVAAMLVAATFDDYGMSWDQPSSHNYGEAVVRFYKTGGADKSALIHLLHPYGGLFELASAGVEVITGLHWFAARTLATALFGLLGIVAILRCGWLIYGPPVGVTAAALLLLTPVYYGHQFINPKDLPFAALSMLALSYIAELVRQYPRIKWNTTVKTGLAIGATMAVRVGGLQLLGVLACGVLAAAWFARGHPEARLSASWRRWALQGMTIVGVAWIVMLAAWPYALSAPLTGPFEALKEFSEFWWPSFVFYDGQLLKAPDLPWTYIPNLLVRTMPEVVLLGLAAALLACTLAWRRRQPAIPPEQRAPTIAVLAAIVLPVLLIWLLRAPLYDGLRHVLFIVPPIVLISALGIWCCAPLLPKWGARTLGITAIALAAATAVELVKLHPYEYIYFNRLIAGGLPTASRRYDHDYWATALREAAEWVSNNYNPTPGKVVVYDSSAEPEQVDRFLRPKAESGAIFRRAAQGEKYRLYFLIRRFHQHEELKVGNQLYSVSREGVPLVEIVETP